MGGCVLHWGVRESSSGRRAEDTEDKGLRLCVYILLLYEDASVPHVLVTPRVLGEFKKMDGLKDAENL